MAARGGHQLQVPGSTRAKKISRLAAEHDDGIVYIGKISTIKTTIATLRQCCAEAGRRTQVRLGEKTPAGRHRQAPLFPPANPSNR